MWTRKTLFILLALGLFGLQSTWAQELGRVPKLTGLSAKEAKARLPRGVIVSVNYQESSRKTGTVVRTFPRKGKKLEKRDVVYLFIAQEPLEQIVEQRQKEKTNSEEKSSSHLVAYLILQLVVIAAAWVGWKYSD